MTFSKEVGYGLLLFIVLVSDLTEDGVEQVQLHEIVVCNLGDDVNWLVRVVLNLFC